MLTILSVTLVAGVATVTFDDKRLVSGPQIGQEGWKGPFHAHTRHYNGFLTGELALVYGDLRTRPKPSVFVFCRAKTKPIIDLVQKLDEEAGRSRKLFVSMVFFEDVDGATDEVKRLVGKEGVANVLLSVYEGKNRAMGDWKISTEAELTAMFYDRKRGLLANHAFRKGEFGKKDVQRLVSYAAVIATPDKAQLRRLPQEHGAITLAATSRMPRHTPLPDQQVCTGPQPAAAAR